MGRVKTRLIRQAPKYQISGVYSQVASKLRQSLLLQVFRSLNLAILLHHSLHRCSRHSLDGVSCSGVLSEFQCGLQRCRWNEGLVSCMGIYFVQALLIYLGTY